MTSEPCTNYTCTCPATLVDDMHLNATGEWHNTTGPAVTSPTGVNCCAHHGEHHRTHGPAIESPDGYLAWYRHGLLHRTNGPALERPHARPDGSSTASPPPPNTSPTLLDGHPATVWGDVWWEATSRS